MPAERITKTVQTPWYVHIWMDQINLLILCSQFQKSIHVSRKVTCSPHKLTEEGREAKRQEQRKQKSISGESQISWVRLPFRAGSDRSLFALQATLYFLFSLFPIYIYSPYSGHQEADLYASRLLAKGSHW